MEKSKLIKAGSIYFLSSLITNIINIFLIPIFTHSLSTDQFGQYNIVAALQGLLSIFITVGIYSGMSRYLYEYKDKNRIKNITLTFSLTWGLLMIALAFIVSPLISEILFNEETNGIIYFRFIVINSVLLCISSIYEHYYSMNYEALKTSLIKIFKIIMTLLFSVYFIVFKGYKVEGVLYSQFWSYLLIIIAVIILDIRNINFIFSKNELKEQLIYGIGLVPGQISTWILTLIDRYFIMKMIDLSAVGIYSLGYKIGMLIEPVFIIPFNSIFTPFKFQVYKDANAKFKFLEMFKFYNFIGWFCVFGLAIFAKLGVHILGTDEYLSAYMIIPIIAFSYYLWGLGSFYALGLHIASKMYLNSGIATIGAFANILLNLVLIPKFQYFGAAIATVFAYIIMNILYYLCGKRYYDIGIDFFLPYKYSFIALILYPIYYVISDKIKNIWLEIPINIVLCIIYLVLSINMGFLTRKEVFDIMHKFIRRLKSKGNNINDAM